MHRTSGFSLMELLIVLTIVGILASIAVPTFQDYAKKSRRADAQSALVGFSNAMERYFTVNSSYTGASLGSSGIFASQAPIDGSVKYYNLTATSSSICVDVTASSSTAYCLTATPISGTAQDDDGVLSLSSTGARGWDKNGDGDTKDSGENCWETSCS